MECKTAHYALACFLEVVARPTHPSGLLVTYPMRGVFILQFIRFIWSVNLFTLEPQY
jgi:hypothetical protein